MKKKLKVDCTVCALLMLGMIIASYGGQLLAPIGLALMAPTLIWFGRMHYANKKYEHLEKMLSPLKERLGYLLESAVELNNRHNLATPNHNDISKSQNYLLSQTECDKIIVTFPLELSYPSRITQAHISPNAKTYLQGRINIEWRNPFFDMNTLGFYLGEIDMKYCDKSKQMVCTLEIKVESSTY